MDLYEKISENEQVDNLHFNIAGNRIVFEEFQKLIGDYLDDPVSVITGENLAEYGKNGKGVMVIVGVTIVLLLIVVGLLFVVIQKRKNRKVFYDVDDEEKLFVDL